MSPPCPPPSRENKHHGCKKIRQRTWVHGLPFPSSKAPAVESKGLITTVCKSHTLFNLSCNSHIQVYYIIIVDILSRFCYYGWIVTAIASDITLGRSRITKRVFRPIDCVDRWWLKDNREILGHHHSCCSVLAQAWYKVVVTQWRKDKWRNLFFLAMYMRWWRNQE
jgi:hypothetical protein